VQLTKAPGRLNEGGDGANSRVDGGCAGSQLESLAEALGYAVGPPRNNEDAVGGV